MRYRAKSDFVSNVNNGERILIAIGDKVYVQQLGNLWEAFSFYSRKSIGIFTEEDLKDKFGPESEFQKPPRGNMERFKGRSFGGAIKSLVILLFFLPLGTIAQNPPVRWSYKAVRVDSNHFEFHVIADIYRGWYIYKPNEPICPYSPIITFDRSYVMKPIDKMETLEYESDGSECIDPPCKEKPYRSTVVFIQLFEMPINRAGIVKGQITWQALSKYYTEEPQFTKFSLSVGAEDDPLINTCASRYVITYPSGILRKIWWRIKHPFGPSWIRKEPIK